MSRRQSRAFLRFRRQNSGQEGETRAWIQRCRREGKAVVLVRSDGLLYADASLVRSRQVWRRIVDEAVPGVDGLIEGRSIYLLADFVVVVTPNRWAAERVARSLLG